MMTEATIYHSSKGPLDIASMAGRHAAAARDKLMREAPDRAAEIAALDARAKAVAEGAPTPAPEAAPAPAMGHNRPPADSPFEAIKVHIDDLYAEAKGWLDGEPIETQGQADDVSRLMGMIKEAERAADDARKLENKAFDEGKAEVQARYAPLISDTKAVRGKTVLAIEACRNALTPWLRRIEEERQAKLAAAQAEADRLAKEAAEKARAADSLDAAEKAEEVFAEAKDAARAVASIDQSRARAGVGTGYRSAILRDNWVAHLRDGQAALRHYWTVNRSALEDFARHLAAADIRAGKRTIPGFDVVNEQRAA